MKEIILWTINQIFAGIGAFFVLFRIYVVCFNIDVGSEVRPFDVAAMLVIVVAICIFLHISKK